MTVETAAGAYEPSPSERVATQVALYEARAREVFGEEKNRWWAVAESRWPHFPEYRASAQGREIPILVLEPVEA